ncbi:MAG: gamma-glutamyltransferase [Deltaproteobacteria bacterium]|nr:gamma-glutamyltransferase [Deltaproteobacteria bacterium]
MPLQQNCPNKPSISHALTKGAKELRILFTSLWALCACVGPASAAVKGPLRAPHGAVASESALASQAGASLLKAGGNAIDAACATALALGVTNPHSSGIGGGGFALVYIAKEKKTYALDFRERAPSGIDPKMFFRDGKPDPKLSRQGGLAVAVPGEVLGLSELVKRWGKLPFAKCVAPAEKLARGYPATSGAAGMFNDVFGKSAFLAKVYSNKPPIAAGMMLKRPGLASTLAAIRRSGPDAYYKGAIAREIVETVRAAGGVMTEQDLLNYKTSDRVPLVLTYRGRQVYSMPPSSSGGIVIAEALGILERKIPDPKAIGHNSSAYLHVLAEALKHGFADRARHMGDTDFVEVPVAHLLDPKYHATLAAKVGENVLQKDQYGTPGANPDPPHDGGTTHLSVIDGEGNAVALTSTVNLWFGASLVTAKSGVVLNNQMDDFAIKPGVENAFRLLGTEKNAVAPNKRPLSSMSPTLVIDDTGVRVAVGGAGGPTIISGTLQVLLNIVDFGMDAQEASAAPRIHHQWMPETLAHEPEIVADVVQALAKRGHKLVERGHITKVNVVSRSEKGIEAAAEWRGEGEPAGY